MLAPSLSIYISPENISCLLDLSLNHTVPYLTSLVHYWIIHTIAYEFTCLLTQYLGQTLTFLITHASSHWFTYSQTHSVSSFIAYAIHSNTHYTCSLAHSKHSLPEPRSLVYSLTHSYTSSLTNCLVIALPYSFVFSFSIFLMFIVAENTRSVNITHSFTSSLTNCLVIALTRLLPLVCLLSHTLSRGQWFVRRHLVSAQRLGIINIFTQTSAFTKRCVIVCEGIYTLENEYDHWRYVYSSFKTLRIIMIYSVIY